MDLKQFVSTLNVKFDDSDIVKIGKNYYLANKDLTELRSSINRDAFSIGLFLGEEGKYFSPSPAFIDLLSRLDTARKIYISSKAEGLFLYGRNILKDSIIKNPDNVESGYVFVQNENDENLGYGIFQEQNGERLVKNLLDKGFYLRKERR